MSCDLPHPFSSAGSTHDRSALYLLRLWEECAGRLALTGVMVVVEKEDGGSGGARLVRGSNRWGKGETRRDITSADMKAHRLRRVLTTVQPRAVSDRSLEARLDEKLLVRR